MSHLLDDEDLNSHQAHRELTLSMSSVLGIFFALALSWALFFGFGYNMGNKARQAVQGASADSTPATTSSGPNFNSFKPAPGSPASSANSTTPSVAVNSPAGPVTTVPPASTRSTEPPSDDDEPTVHGAPAPAPIVLHPSQPAMEASTAPTGSYVVQIAAVSHQEDADLLVGALRGKGYSVAAHAEPDKLVHIQVGPFSNRKDADAMRQRLLSDGYNAIVK